MGNASGDEDNAIDHHQRPDDAASDARQETGEKSIPHELEVQRFDHFNSPGKKLSTKKQSTKSHED
jgi:hypothetical protein